MAKIRHREGLATTLVLMIGSVNAAARRPSYIFLCGICQWVQRRLKWSRVR
jgi:hypothetical protein